MLLMGVWLRVCDVEGGRGNWAFFVCGKRSWSIPFSCQLASRANKDTRLAARPAFWGLSRHFRARNPRVGAVDFPNSHERQNQWRTLHFVPSLRKRGNGENSGNPKLNLREHRLLSKIGASRPDEPEARSSPNVPPLVLLSLNKSSKKPTENERNFLYSRPSFCGHTVWGCFEGKPTGQPPLWARSSSRG